MAPSMVEIENQRTDCDCQRNLNALLELTASTLSFIEIAKEENLQNMRDHQTTIHATTFLRKKYEANGQVAPSCTQLESYIAEFNQGSQYTVPITLLSNEYYRVNFRRGTCQCCRSQWTGGSRLLMTMANIDGSEQILTLPQRKHRS